VWLRGTQGGCCGEPAPPRRWGLFPPSVFSPLCGVGTPSTRRSCSSTFGALGTAPPPRYSVCCVGCEPQLPEGRFIDLWEDELKTARLIARPRLRSRLNGFASLGCNGPSVCRLSACGLAHTETRLIIHSFAEAAAEADADGADRRIAQPWNARLPRRRAPGSSPRCASRLYLSTSRSRQWPSPSAAGMERGYILDTRQAASARRRRVVPASLDVL